MRDKELVKIAGEFCPHLIGITATTPTFRNDIHVTSILRKVLPEAIFVCGGAHPTASPEECLHTSAFDFLVLGEGEETLLELMKSSLASGEDVLISGFGKFCVKQKEERKGRNPATGEDLILESRKVVTFKCSGKLRERVNG